MVGARPRLRRHGGGPGAERRHADGSGRLRGPLPSRLLSPPDESGIADDPRRGRRPRRAIVQHSTGDVSEVEGKETFRMTCSFHAPEEGDSYQLPVAPDIPPPREIEGFEAPFPFDVRELGATERREDGTYESTRRCWFRTTGALSDDPAVHACALAYFSDMTGASFRPLSLGVWGTHTDASLDHALWFHRPWRADVVEHLRPPRARERRWPGHRPGDDARRGRHLAPEHGAGIADPGARRAAADHDPDVDGARRATRLESTDGTA